MSRTLLSLAGFQVIFIGRFWVIAEEGSRRWGGLYANSMVLGLSKGLREQVRTQEKSERRIDFSVVCMREERQLEPRLERDRLFGARRAHNASGWRGAPRERGRNSSFMRRLRRERVENGV